MTNQTRDIILLLRLRNILVKMAVFLGPFFEFAAGFFSIVEKKRHLGSDPDTRLFEVREAFNPFRTAVPFWGQTTRNLSGLSQKRDCGSRGVKRTLLLGIWAYIRAYSV